MGFRGSNGTSHKLKKSRGRRTYSNFKKTGETFVCPECRNVNSNPLKNTEGKRYCSACWSRTGQVVIMKKRNIVTRK